MGNMTFDIRGAKAQMPVSAHEKAFIVEYEADMADAHANEYFAFVLLPDVDKLEWIRLNDIEMFNSLNVR